MKNNLYTEQVRLMVALLPCVAKQACFALKSGTAIHLFARDMARYPPSVSGGVCHRGIGGAYHSDDTSPPF